MDTAPLRIRVPEAAGAFSTQAVRESGDLYLSRHVKLVPSEVVALYLTFKETAETWLGVWSTICLGLVVLTRTLGTHEAGKRVQVGAVLVSMVSFTLWGFTSRARRVPFTVTSMGCWAFTRELVSGWGR